MKTKTSTEVCQVFEKMLKKIPRFKNLHSDEGYISLYIVFIFKNFFKTDFFFFFLGKEYINKKFEYLMKKYKINHYITYSHLKAAICERFNRTLKNKLWKEFSYQGNYKWINILQEIVKKYNNTIHRTIRRKPIEVNKKNEKEIFETVYKLPKITTKPRFHIGDKVRISKYKNIFDKGYTTNFSHEIYTIEEIIPSFPISTYILKDNENKVLKGSFYSHELQKTKYPDIYLIEKIIKKKGNQAFVKFLGYNNRHNAWVNLE